MRRGLALAVMLGALAFPAAADAHYYMNAQQAVSTTRRFLHGLGYHYSAAICHPQGLKAAKPGYIYHRWVCGWAAGDRTKSPDCEGSSLVRGSSDESQFYWRVDWHDGDCQYGVK